MRLFAKLMMGLALALAVTAHAQDSEELAALVRANSWPIAAEEWGLGGPGAPLVTGWAGQAHFFLLGENHGNAGMAKFATGLSNALAGHGYRYTAIEVDPLMTTRLTEAMAGGKQALAKWLAADKRGRAIPFYFWSEEADFIASSLRRGQIWGLDQAFLGAAHLHLDEIAARSVSAAVREQAKALAAEARADVTGFLGKVDVERLKSVRAAMPANEAAEAVTTLELLIESAEIYKPFTAGTGSAYLANLRRETRMKRLFLDQYRAAERRDGAAPKVLFKFGSNHLERGLSSTHVPSLGNFVEEMGLGSFGAKTFSLRMICGPGTQQALFDGKAIDCGEDEFGPYAALKPYLAASGDTLIHLRPLRDRPRLWKGWPPQMQALIWNYDSVAVIGASGPSTFLAPMP